MTPLRTYLLVVFALVALAAAAGCGEDEEPSNSSTVPPALTNPGARQEAPRGGKTAKVNPSADSKEKKVFLEEASAACTDARRKLKKVQQDLLKAGRGDQAKLQQALSGALKKQIEITKSTTDTLSDIEPPASVEKQYARFLKLRGEVAEAQTEYQEALADRKPKRVSQLAQKQASAERRASGIAALMSIENC